MSLPNELLSSHPIPNKMNRDVKQPWSDCEIDWLDFDSLSQSPLVLELKASVVQAGRWTIIQHVEFDVDVDSEPYHASQVLVNRVTREFIVRVWGRTFRKGTVSGITELHGVCESGKRFNREKNGLSFGLKNRLRIHFDSDTCLNYPFFLTFS